MTPLLIALALTALALLLIAGFLYYQQQDTKDEVVNLDQFRRERPVPNIALKVAIIESDKRQREIARSTRIPETRLSHIVRGRVDATDKERAALARVLGKRQGDLFPSEEAVSA